MISALLAVIIAAPVLAQKSSENCSVCDAEKAIVLSPQNATGWYIKGIGPGEGAGLYRLMP